MREVKKKHETKTIYIKNCGNVIEKKGSSTNSWIPFRHGSPSKIGAWRGKRRTQLLTTYAIGTPNWLAAGRPLPARGLKVITMVYGGWPNKNIVAQLQPSNALASGCEAITFRAVKRPVREK